MPRLVLSLMIEWTAANKQVLDIDKRHKTQFVTKRKENLPLSGYYAVNVRNFLPTSGASLSFPTSCVKDY